MGSKGQRFQTTFLIVAVPDVAVQRIRALFIDRSSNSHIVQM
jgi:hypothetical protein